VAVRGGTVKSLSGASVFPCCQNSSGDFAKCDGVLASAGCHVTCLVSFGFAEGCGGPKAERGTLITLPGGCRNSKCTFIFALYFGVPSGLRSFERRTCEITTVALIRVPSVKLNMTTFDPATLASTTSASTWSSANCVLLIQSYRFIVPLTLVRNSGV